MAVDFARTLVVYLKETPLGVVFRRCEPRADGSPGDAQCWNHAEGGWDNVFAAAKHVRKMDRPFVDRADYQCFPVPLDLLDDRGVVATVHVLNQAGGIVANFDQLQGPHLASLVGSPSSRP